MGSDFTLVTLHGLQGAMNAASALVFLGWPGQNEPEDDALNAPLDSSLASPMPSQGSSCYQDALGLGPGAISAQMSPDTAEKMSNGPFGGKKLM